MGEVAAANNKSGYEAKYSDPNGVIFDISADGWEGAQKNPGPGPRHDEKG
jgi:hypothetical protein